MKETEGGQRAQGFRFGIVVARFNEFLTRPLLADTVETLKSCGAEDAAIEVFWVPGSFEIPLVVRTLAERRQFHALMGLGVILKGGTEHDKLLAENVARGIARVNQDTGIPVIWGVLSVDSVEQAKARIEGPDARRGRQFALAAVEMAGLMKKISEKEGGLPKDSLWPRLFSKT